MNNSLKNIIKEYIKLYLENNEVELFEDELTEFSGAGGSGGNTVSSAMGGSSLGGTLSTNNNVKTKRKNKNKKLTK